MQNSRTFNRFLPLLLAVSGFFILLTGCVIVINQPSAEEKELLAIQDTVGKQISDIGQKVSTGSATPYEINDYIAQAENTVSQAIQRISELNIPAKTKKFADDTIAYLQSAKKIFEQIKSLLSDLEKLQKEGQLLSEQAKAAIKEQMSSIQSNISGFTKQINRIAGQLQQARKQMMDLYEKAK